MFGPIYSKTHHACNWGMPARQVRARGPVNPSLPTTQNKGSEQLIQLATYKVIFNHFDKQIRSSFKGPWLCLKRHMYHAY